MPTRKKLLARTVMLATLFALLSAGVYAQKTVSGKVTNKANGQPIAGATIQLRGTSTVTVTNVEGIYSINTKGAGGTLVATVVGFEPMEQPINGRNLVSFVLTETTASLSEVLVTGYSTQRKKDITGSVAVVNINNMKSVPSGTTESILQGQASGVSVINSGAPGGGSNIRIRGITSLGNSNPLVIIDGAQGSLHDLNVNDIESVQVLKDAGAAAIYGVQGSNGVVIVTTKKGKSGKAKVTYDAFVGTQRPLKNGFNLANTPEYASVIWAQAKNSGVSPSHPQFGNGASPVIPDYITPSGAKEGDPNTNPAAYDINKNQITKANKVGTDWFHETFKPAMIQSHSISVSGGNDKSAYLFSVGYFNQQGTLLNTYLKRYSVRLNTVFNVKDHIRIGENAYVFYKQNPGFTNQNEGNAISFTYREPPIIPIYDIMGNFAGTKSKGLSNSQNPVANQMRTADNRGNDWQVNGNVFAEVDFLQHFTARTSFGGNFDNYYYYYFNYTPYENAEGNTNPTSFTEGSGYNSQWLWTNTLQYTNVFGKHNVKALIGSEAKQVYNRGFSAGRSNYYSINPNFWTLNTGDPGTQSNSGGSPTQLALYSLFGRVDYNYDDKYLLSGTIRRDGASVFDKDHRYGNFPSVTLGWRLSRESFMRTVSWINDLKLRGGWGKLGSISNINPTNPFTLYGSAAGNSYYAIAGQSSGATQGFYLRQFGNQNTTWEEDIVTNVGLDATLFKNKIDFSIEWYKKAISGLLFPGNPVNAAFIGGGSPPFVNLGNIQNTGIDFSVTYHGKALRNELSFDLTGNITAYRSKIVSLPVKYVDYNSDGSTRIGAFTRAQEGQPIGEFFGYDVVGLFRDAQDVSKSPTQDGAGPGRFKYRDVDGNGKINASDRTFFGNPNPKFTYGFNISASYKSFDFSTFFYGSYGNDVINYVRYWTDFPQVFGGNVSKDAVYNSWSPSNLNAKVPVLEQTANFSNSSVFNSYYKESGSYLRCKSMILGYSFAPAKLKTIGIEKLRVFVQAANLFTITKYTGLDPELQGSNLNTSTNFGIDFGNYPANQKNYNIGVSVSF